MHALQEIGNRTAGAIRYVVSLAGAIALSVVVVTVWGGIYAAFAFGAILVFGGDAEETEAEGMTIEECMETYDVSRNTCVEASLGGVY